MKPKIYVYEPASTLGQIFRVAVIIGGVALAIVGGLIITGLEWISGGGVTDENNHHAVCANF